MTNDCPFRDVCAEHLQGELADGDCYTPENECRFYWPFIAIHNAAIKRAIEKSDLEDKRLPQPFVYVHELESLEM